MRNELTQIINGTRLVESQFSCTDFGETRAGRRSIRTFTQREPFRVEHSHFTVDKTRQTAMFEIIGGKCWMQVSARMVRFNSGEVFQTCQRAQEDLHGPSVGMWQHREYKFFQRRYKRTATAAYLLQLLRCACYSYIRPKKIILLANTEWRTEQIMLTALPC